jgi:small-conductance mechanosensitive channel/CRP-like cAMP-binding protein
MSEYLIEGAAIGVVSLLALIVAKNRVIRRRMMFTLAVLGGALVLDVAHVLAGARLPIFNAPFVSTAAGMLIVFCAINTGVALAFNPWFSNRVRDHAPAIVQDALVIGLSFAAVLLSLSGNETKTLAGSAIAAAVLGFALQETLGNAFAGLAIQTEKPFRVGHWVSVGEYEGRVIEVTWRATKIRTDEGNLVVLPNNVVARDPIVNFTEPTAPTRLSVDVGAAYAAPPNAVRDAMLTAARHSTKYVLASPEPDVLVVDFAASAITYRVRFWLNDKQDDDEAQDEVRTAIYYEFARRGIEIPYPTHVEYAREEEHEAADTRIGRYAQIISQVPVLAPLFREGHEALARSAREHVYGDGEVIVREGDPGASMFVIAAGDVAVTIGAGHEVARIAAGGFFGEMSLLTGDPRSATVTARGDCRVLEIGAAAFKDYVTTHQGAIETIAAAAADRRRELDTSRAAAAASTAEARATLADRMRRFFGLKPSASRVSDSGGHPGSPARSRP